MPDNKPLVSIVTSSFNRAAYAEASARSLLGQTYPNFEVIVVEDGSSDDSLQVLRAISDSRMTLHPQSNSGYRAALNAAIARSRGDYVAIHDFGDISAPERIARQAEVLMRRPEVGVVGCWVRRRDVETGDVTHLRHRKTRPFPEAILREVPFTHGEVMYRRRLFDAVGGYRPPFRYAIDRDLFIRMSRLCEYAVIEEVLYEQLLFPDGVSTAPEKLILQAYFAELANQSGERVLAGESDLVEAYAEAAPFFVRRSRRVANRLARNALKPMANGQREASRKLVDAALREALTPASVVIAAVDRLVFCSAATRRLLLPLLAAARTRWTGRRA